MCYLGCQRQRQTQKRCGKTELSCTQKWSCVQRNGGDSGWVALALLLCYYSRLITEAQRHGRLKHQCAGGSARTKDTWGDKQVGR
jgi:hypothetical protein